MTERLALDGLTHDDLVLRAGKWLRSTMRCPVVLLEPGYGYVGEIPDAIGWHRGWSCVVECKATRNDFLADRNKPARRRVAQDGGGLGAERYFLTNPGVASIDELPDGWRLLVLKGGRVCRIGHRKSECVQSLRTKESMRDEIKLLAACMAHVQHQENGYVLSRSRHLEHNLGGIA